MPQWLNSWNAGIANFLSPSATYAGSGMTEDEIKAAQRAARLQMAAGLLSGVGSGGASPLAKGLGAGLQGVAGVNENAMQNAYRNTMLKKQMEREDRLLQAQEAELTQKTRERAAITASRVTQGMTSATDPAAYWSLVQSTPEVQEMMKVYQIDPATAQAGQLQTQLGTAGQLGLPYNPQGLQLKAVVDPGTGQPVYRPEAQAVGMQPYYEGAVPSATELTEKRFSRANVLRDEYSSQLKDFRTVEAMYGNIQATAKNPSAAGDIALLTAFMKLNDPGSTVREGEFATAQNAGGVDDRIRAQYNNLLTGERLTPEQRQDFTTQAAAIHEQRQKQANRIRREYTDLAKRAEVDPLDVVGREGEPQEYTATDAKGNKIVWRGDRWVPQ